MTARATPASARPSRISDLCASALGVSVFIVSAAAFLPALGAGFVDMDDTQLLVQNTAFRGFSAGNLEWMFSATPLGHYQPLTWLSYALDHAMWGMNPRGFHLTNILLHATNAVLVYVLAMRLMRAAHRGDDGDRQSVGGNVIPVGAAAGALLWSCHPLRVESVAWVTERRDVLSVMFLLGATTAYLQAFAPGEIRVQSRGWYAASIGLLLLSLLAEALGMTFFAVMLVLDWYPLGRLPPLSCGAIRAWGTVLIQKTPYVVLGAAAAVVAAWASHSVGAMRQLEGWSVAERAAQCCYGLVFYLWKTAVPTGLAALYELPDHLDPWAARNVAAYGLVASLIAAALALRRRARWFAAALAVYVIQLSPVLGVVQSGTQLVADRYSYVACVGWSMLAGALLLSVHTKLARRVLAPAGVGVVAAVICALVVATVGQTKTWRDPVTLWSHAVEVEADSGLTRTYLGMALQSAGKPGEAMEQFRIATRLRPMNGLAWYQIGNALKAAGDTSGGEAAYRQAAPNMIDGFRARVNLGNMLLNQPGRLDDAIKEFRAAVEEMERVLVRWPAYTSRSGLPYLSLGVALAQRGDFAAAREVLAEAAEFAETRELATRQLQRLDQSQ